MPSLARVIAYSDLLLVPVAARSRDALPPEWSGRDRPASQPQGGHPQKPIGQGLPVFAAEIWRSQIWPSLTLPVRPVGGVCARPRFRPNTWCSARPAGGAGEGGLLDRWVARWRGGRPASLRSAGEADTKAAW